MHRRRNATHLERGDKVRVDDPSSALDKDEGHVLEVREDGYLVDLTSGPSGRGGGEQYLRDDQLEKVSSRQSHLCEDCKKTTRPRREARAASKGIWGAIENWFENKLAPEIIDWLGTRLGASQVTKISTSAATMGLRIVMEGGVESDYDTFHVSLDLEHSNVVPSLAATITGLRGEDEYLILYGDTVGGFHDRPDEVVKNIVQKADFQPEPY